MEIKLHKVLHDLVAVYCSTIPWQLARGQSSFTLALLTNTHNKNWEPHSRWILVSVLVSFIFRLAGYCSVVLLSNKELGKVKYCTIENHLYLWLALCVSTSSTGTSDTRKNASNRDKRLTNKKVVEESKRSVFSAQYNYSWWVIDRSSMSNQLHQWVINAIDE